MSEPAATAPHVDPGGVTFFVPDAEHELKTVRLVQEIERPRAGPEFERCDGGWTLAFARPHADRLEYLIELVGPDGSSMLCDPANPKRAPGPFGDKSVVEWPGYDPPGWVDEQAPSGTRTEHLLPSRILRDRLPVVVWSAPGIEPDEPRPLLIAHDGIEYDRYSALTKLLEVATANGAIPPARAALLGPVDRNETYSASASYARAFAHEILEGLAPIAPSFHERAARVGAGASLGALSMLHLHRTEPWVLGGLLLQSGSFFRQRFDRQEAGFPRFGRIARFTGRVLRAETWEHPVPVAMTCGSAEENLRNNLAVRDALRLQGYPLTWHEQPDAHNWVSWRDALHPALTELLGYCWEAWG